MVALIPVVVLILAGTGLLTYRLSHQYIAIAIKRNVTMRNLAAVNEVERFLERCRRDALFFAAGSTDAASLAGVMKRKVLSGDNIYFELGYLSANTDDHSMFLLRKGKVQRVDAGLEEVSPSPELYLDSLSGLQPGTVWISQILEVEYPLPAEGRANTRIHEQVIRFVTPSRGADGTEGLLILSVPARQIRNILSLYNSTRSPLWAFPRSDELRFSYMMDTDGWMLFQSEDVDVPDGELTTYTARSGLEGTLGRQGHPTAFRPAENNSVYWAIVARVASGERDIELLRDTRDDSALLDEYYAAYAPVVYRPDGIRSEVYGGVVFIDRSQLPVLAGYRYLDLMLIISFSSIILIALYIYFLGRNITAPIRELAYRMRDFKDPRLLKEIEFGYHGRDIDLLRDSINAIIRRVKQQIEVIRQKDETIMHVNQREPADMSAEQAALAETSMSLIPEIVGTGKRIADLKASILKAANVDVDVLITGETGTGKQLVAEAIHNHSERSRGSFVSINCGALDENLLLDALFGHVKGAFTEARTDRKGAFQEADGGTLFLDEIQSASPKVQQSLLRALSMRCIKPLGSDREVEVNVRIVAATNADLTAMIEEKTFREDLYYRLQVFSITTPPLREQKENVSVLALHYLHQTENLVNREDMGFSNGALRKLKQHNWPGNIRELVNTVTRSAVMAEADIIQAEDIRLSGPLAVGAELVGGEAYALAGAGETGGPAGMDTASQGWTCPPSETETETGTGTGTEAARTAAESGQTGSSKQETGAVGAEHSTGVLAPPRNGPDPDQNHAEGATSNSHAAFRAESSIPLDLSQRQRLVWPRIAARGGVSRSEYQKWAGDIPSRTAIYDLQDLVKRGLLRKQGQGPATRYVMASR